ncbi:hypothetical protein O9X80_07885 [Agrobacterium salinitolerans]|uniref:hypothetical protein n=1 Tax=Agrobacterium salinitolerans TaxID=1183413 RepID=UPI0022B817A8|nr:hypothetical protein [Agrobacterium salinitolerans]MCZ7974408.1 hypothetical protein [Agrobacterium salinitolerans]
MSEMTTSEKAWFNKLYRLLNAMPVDVEVQVHNSHLQMNRKGARNSAFECDGHGDNAESLDHFDTLNFRIYPCSESV